MSVSEHLSLPVSQFITPQTLTLDAAMTIDQAIAHLRTHAQSMPAEHAPLYFYVTEQNAGRQKLVGILSSRQLLLSPGSASVSSLMNTKVITITNHETLFEACEIFALHRLLALPVVDRSGKFLGTLDVSLYTDELLDMAQTKNDSPVFQMLGLHLEQSKNRNPFAGFKNRMPWLLANIAGGLVCAALGTLFEHALQTALLVSLFIPVILTLAESIAIQSMTLTLQAPISTYSARTQITREGLTALMLGLCSASIVTAAALLWRAHLAIPMVIAIAIVGSMLIAGLLGTLVPRAVRYFRLDPNIAAGPIALAMTDIFSVTLLFSMTAHFAAGH